MAQVGVWQAAESRHEGAQALNKMNMPTLFRIAAITHNRHLAC